MTEPMKEEYKALAGILGDALDHRDGVGLYGDDLFTAYKALLLAANLPSESEIERIIDKYVFESGEGELQRADEAAARILERIRSVK